MTFYLYVDSATDEVMFVQSPDTSVVITRTADVLITFERSHRGTEIDVFHVGGFHSHVLSEDERRALAAYLLEGLP